MLLFPSSSRAISGVWLGLFVAILLMALFPLSACGPEEAHQPPYYEVVELRGSPYERGVQHGRHFASKIRSLYTQLLTASILPWLNREQPDLASVLKEYDKPLYGNGQFSYQVLLQSGQNLKEYIPEPYLEEMQGVADGAGLPFEQILVLNTFVDTLLSMRSITFLIRLMRAPQIRGVEFFDPSYVPENPMDPGGLPPDGVDNDGDGMIDEENEGLLWPYEPSPYATLAEVPENIKVRISLEDPNGVDPASVRIQLDENIFVAGHNSIETKVHGRLGQYLDVLFTPPEGLPRASTVAFQFQAADFDLVTNPPPSHTRIMRDERIVFTTEGFGKEPHEVANRGARDDRFQPSSIAFGLRRSATSTGQVLAAHHLAVLDTNTAHKHTALFLHRPNEGKPYAVLGWSGVIWGFSGMNSDGLVHLTNIADTQDQSMAGEILTHLLNPKLLCSGIPVGIMGREILTKAGTVEQALEYLEGKKSTFGWNILLADPRGALAAAELDSNILGAKDGGFYVYAPEADNPNNLDPWGRRWASVGADDLRIDSHYQRNRNDIDLKIFGFPLLKPQRYVSTFYFRSLRPFYILGEQIDAAYGELDVPRVIQILRIPDLIDKRDSMNAVIYAPEKLILYFAMGQIPATDGPFIPFDLGAALR